MNHKEIRDLQHQLTDDRRKKQRELMQEYDETIYEPARRANMQACESLGHKLREEFYNNGVGGIYQYCKWCGATVFKEDNE